MNDKKLTARLLATLYRRDCPDPRELGEYLIGLLAETRHTELRVHLARCPHCQAEMARLNEFLTEDIQQTPTSAEPAWTQASNFRWRLGEAGQIMIKLLVEGLNKTFSSLTQPLYGQPAFAAAKRGSRESDIVLCKLDLTEAAEALEVTITAETKPNNPAECMITVEVNIPSRGGWPHLANTEVTLKQNELIKAVHTTDAFGKAVFEEVAIAELPLFTFEITPDTL
jgi:hypothetical protein